MLHLLYLSSESVRKRTFSDMEPEESPAYRARLGPCRIGIDNNLIHPIQLEKDSEEIRKDNDKQFKNDGDSSGDNVSVDDNTNATLENKIRRPFGSCIRFLKARGYWSSIMNAISFIVHFLFVMMILFGGAVVFAYIEDGDLIKSHDEASHSLQNDTKRSSNSSIRFAKLWTDLHEKYRLNVTIGERENLTQHFRDFIHEEDAIRKASQYRDLHGDINFIFRKWFYFVTIVSTTIGYGDVSPSTDDGRLFYIFFSIVVVAIMMTLLRRCGTVISAANRKVFDLITKYLCRKEDGLISKEILSLISILLIFTVYLIAGIYYDQGAVNWTLVDTIYYWIVTFTTVGFGDLLIPLQFEMENMHFYIVYRIFGLAFLAAIIDAIQKCVAPEHIRAQRDKIAGGLKGLADGMVEGGGAVLGAVAGKKTGAADDVLVGSPEPSVLQETERKTER